MLYRLLKDIMVKDHAILTIEAMPKTLEFSKMTGLPANFNTKVPASTRKAMP